MKKKIIVVIVVLVLSMFLPTYSQNVFADELSDNIEYQLNNLDLTELQEYFDSMLSKPDNIEFFDILKQMLGGNFEMDFTSVYKYISSVFFSEILKFIPLMLSLIAIFLLNFLIKQTQSNNMISGDNDIVRIIVQIVSLLIISSSVALFFNSSIQTLNKINNLIEILSPIIFSLMIACENLSSVNVFKISNGYLSIIITNIIIKILIPIIFISYILKLLSVLSNTFNFKNFANGLENFVKKTLFAIFFIFGLLITIKGLGAKTFDGISIKATKYALSNSIPIVGTFVKDSFDVITAGSILIKNSLGISCVIILFFLIVSPLISMFSFNILLKLTNGIIGCFDNTGYNAITDSTTKFIDYLCAFIIVVGFSLFIIILLIILCSGGI